MNFSKSSYNALDYAIKSSKEYGAKIILLHAIQKIYPQKSIQNLIVEDNSFTKKNIDAKLIKLLISKMKKNEMECEYELISEFGTPFDVIQKAIEKIKPDYVILGEKKANSKIDTLFRDNTFKISTQSRNQIIIIREGVSYKKINKIVFATDYHERDINAIRNLAEIAKPYEIKILVLHVSDGDLTTDFEETMLNDFGNKIRRQIKYDNISFQLIEGKNIINELGKYVNKKYADLFALTTNFHSWLNNLIGNNITSQMLQQTKIPLLIYYYKEEGDLLYTKSNTEEYEKVF